MITLLKLSEIKRTTEMQPRTTMQMAVAEDYAEDIKAGAKFPPLTVFHVDEEYILVDGFHRALALQSAGAKKAQCEVLEGTMRDAFLYASGVNAGHGLRRTNDDKRRAVERLLNDPEWSQWSDNKIADICKVDPKTVAKLRENSMEIHRDPEAEPSKVRMFATKKGTVSKINTENIGKKPVSGLGTVPKDHPNYGVGCAQPGSLPAETDAPVQPSLAEQMKDEIHGTETSQGSDGRRSCVQPAGALHRESFKTASQVKNGIAGEMEFPDLKPWTPALCKTGPCPGPNNGKSYYEPVPKDGKPHLKGDVCGRVGIEIKQLDNCPLIKDLQKRQAAAQAAGGFTTGNGTPSPQGKPLTNEHPPLKVIPVQLTKEQAEAAITSVVRGYFTPKSQEQWTQLKKVGGWDTDLEALEGLRDDAAERIT